MPATRSPSHETHVLLGRLAALRVRTRIHLAIDGIASVSLAFVSICLLSFGIDRVFRLPRGQRAFLLLVLGAVCGALIWRRLVARLRVALPLVELARAVEKMAPQLDWRLVSAVQFLENQDPRGSKELAQLVVADAERVAEPLHFSSVLDTRAVAGRAARGALSLACGLALVIPANLRPTARTWFERCILLSATAEWPKDTQLIVTTVCGPLVTEIGGNRMRVAIPRGSDLAVIVSARGVIPTRATLSFEFATSHIRGSRPLARLGDNRFRHVFEKVVEDCDFYVRGGDDEVGPIHVSVVRPPWIDGLTITADPPRYTRIPRKTFGIEVGEIQLPVGTTITIVGHCTKDTASAALDVRFAGTRLDAPPEQHLYVSSLGETRAAEEVARALDKKDYPAAFRAYRSLGLGLETFAAGSDKRAKPLADWTGEVVAITSRVGALSKEDLAREAPELVKQLGKLGADPRLTAVTADAAIAPLQTMSFTFVLEKTAACSFDVTDTDELHLERPIALTLRAIPDAPPKVQLQANGIGQLITPECVIPLDIKASDDYGLYSCTLRWKTAGPNQKPGEGEVRITLPNAKREGDLPRDADVPYDWDVGALHVPAGTFVNFICEVQDDDPKGHKQGISTSIALRVVNPEELLMDLIRRQHELRRELERVKEDEAKLAEGLDALDSKALERAGKKQREVQKTIADTARAMTQVVDEMRNNRLLDERARTRLQDDVITPLETLRDGEMVRSRDLSDQALAAKDAAERDGKSKEAASSTREVIVQLDAIIAHMKRVTDLAELVARLREFLKKQRDLMEETRKQGGSR